MRFPWYLSPRGSFACWKNAWCAHRLAFLHQRKKKLDAPTLYFPALAILFPLLFAPVKQREWQLRCWETHLLSGPLSAAGVLGKQCISRHCPLSSRSICLLRKSCSFLLFFATHKLDTPRGWNAGRRLTLLAFARQPNFRIKSVGGYANLSSCPSVDHEVCGLTYRSHPGTLH